MFNWAISRSNKQLDYIPRKAVLNHRPLPLDVKSRPERVKAKRAALREEVEAAVSAAKREEG